MKISLTLIFSVITVFYLKGQLLNSFGFKTGITIANQTWKYKSVNLTLNKEYKTGIYTALTVDFFKLKYYNLTADIGFYQKGACEKVIISDPFQPEVAIGSIYYNTLFNYLLFNPMLKVKLPIKKIIPYGLIGFRVDYQLSYKSDYNLESIQGDFRKVIYGLTTGAGLEFKIKRIGINTEFQYQYDLTKVIDIPISATSTGLSITNNGFIASIGLKYYLK